MINPNDLPDNFYERVGPRLIKRIGNEIRLARRVLDFGCGSCDLVRYLAETYHQEVTGVDIALGKFPSGRRTATGRPFHCLNRDAAHLKTMADESVDAVVMVWALHEMIEPEAVFKESRRVLRPGGKIMVVDFPNNSLAERLWHERYYHPDQVESFLTSAGLEKVKVSLIEHEQVILASAYQPPVKN